jgi:hypothetical protein
MMMMAINGKQMKRLQTLWGLFARQAGLDAKDRGARLGWVAGAIGRQISSCSELTAAEGKTAIDAIQKHLPAEMLMRTRPSRETARAYGTAGRKSAHKSTEVRMADAGTLQLLANLCTALGWGRERLDAFLRSRKSPVRSGTIRTLAEANRVIWILKSMLRRAQAKACATRTAAAPDQTPAPFSSNTALNTADEMGAR